MFGIALLRKACLQSRVGAEVSEHRLQDSFSSTSKGKHSHQDSSLCINNLVYAERLLSFANLEFCSETENGCVTKSPKSFSIEKCVSSRKFTFLYNSPTEDSC